MKKNLRQAAAGALAAALVIGGAAWYLWDHRPMEVPDLDPAEIAEIRVEHVAGEDSPAQVLFTQEEKDIRALTDLFNEMTVRKDGAGADPEGYQIEITPVSEDTAGAAGWSWDNVCLSGDRLWHDGMYYRIDDGLAGQIQELIEEIEYRPIDVLDIDPEWVTQIIYVFDGNVYDAVHIEEPEDVRQFCQLLNQMVVRKVRSDWARSGWDRITVYRQKGYFGGTTSLGDWAWDGWNGFYLNDDQVWYDGVYYEVDKDLADEIRALARDIQRRQQEEAA